MPILMLVIVGHSFGFSPRLHAGIPSIPGNDFIGPTIEHSVVTDSIEVGTAYQIKAVVTDNVGVKIVLLFYRVAGTEDYKRVQMSPVDGTDNYTVTLGYKETIEPGIEYYFQAIDYAGNSFLYGYSFSPLQLRIVKNQTQQIPELVQSGAKGNPKPDKKSEGKLDKWVWIGLSVLAVGVIAAVAGGDDSADQNSGAKPETGSIIISGPGP